MVPTEWCRLMDDRGAAGCLRPGLLDLSAEHRNSASIDRSNSAKFGWRSLSCAGSATPLQGAIDEAKGQGGFRACCASTRICRAHMVERVPSKNISGARLDGSSRRVKEGLTFDIAVARPLLKFGPLVPNQLLDGRRQLRSLKSWYNLTCE